MKHNRLMPLLLGLTSSGAAVAHSVNGTHHGLMFFHWHIGDSGLVLGLPASLIGLASLVAAVAALVVGVRFFRARRSRPATLSLLGASAVLAFIGSGLLIGAA